MNRLLLALCCLGLVACDPLEPTTPKAPELEDEREDVAPPAIEDNTKPTAPVNLSYELNERGDLLEIVLFISSSDPDASVYVSLLDAAGNTLVERQAVTMNLQQEGRVGEQRFLIPPHQQGQRQVSVQLDVDMEMGRLSRSLAVDLGTSRPRSAMEKMATAAKQPAIEEEESAEAGELLVSLPAEEVNLR